MIVYNEKENLLKITIPLLGIEELRDYQNGVLGVLRQIEIDDCNPELMGHVMSVYKLLGHIMVDKEFFSQNGKLASDHKDSTIRGPKRKTKKS
ncbi:hypothetical protein QQ020_23345 [Fulvivirgaceae bacterium BMA12]|uniref:Transposase n=1 Tax=Agaribacillus aureus TaxID=3051825 RepID=A0ABT8LD95_9BACT|nr:hypothetical protein [Fulvivirgaceae bacterium BMA12]